MNPSDRTALVTGGASGLGEAVAHELHEAGANVVILDLPDSEGDKVAQELGDRATFSGGDVTDPDEVQQAIDTARDQFGGLQIVVNCAGIATAARVVGKKGPHDLDMFRTVVMVNLIGTFNVIRLTAASMIEQDLVDDQERGVIVNTASVAAYEGQIGQVAYAAAKGGVVSLTLPVARDLAQHAIRCVTIAPGTFETPMLAGLPEQTREALAENILHPGRFGKPAEFALLTRQIVENPYLNGEVIRLDGALRMPPA